MLDSQSEEWFLQPYPVASVDSMYNDCFYIVQGIDFELSPLIKPSFARGKTYQQWLLGVILSTYIVYVFLELYCTLPEDKKKNITVPIDIKQPILKALLITNRPVKPTADLASLVRNFVCCTERSFSTAARHLHLQHR
ncbi:LOW QUALITY PROTEIN: hypothetical protein RvY_11961 [Ramazzottius varieornatus]|uniref:Uncharacterized protein n=1 Tax=Ramazzottius varieornatus TaxID=947166 RepID=A0A1D1VNA0_RAMVA|nr:LOW QUALITY PROTEIN: hypothetical protein RvY_11961 [Ramazzottius varieornatus]